MAATQGLMLPQNAAVMQAQMAAAQIQAARQAAAAAVLAQAQMQISAKQQQQQPQTNIKAEVTFNNTKPATRNQLTRRSTHQELEQKWRVGVVTRGCVRAVGRGGQQAGLGSWTPSRCSWPMLV